MTAHPSKGLTSATSHTASFSFLAIRIIIARPRLQRNRKIAFLRAGFQTEARFVFVPALRSPSASSGRTRACPESIEGDTRETLVEVIVAVFTDTERPYASGRVGVYVEDAIVYFDKISVEGKEAVP